MHFCKLYQIRRKDKYFHFIDACAEILTGAGQSPGFQAVAEKDIALERVASAASASLS